jgi:hypothetical protein
MINGSGRRRTINRRGPLALRRFLRKYAFAAFVVGYAVGRAVSYLPSHVELEVIDAILGAA